jgi:hypothetical protein
MDVDDGAPRPKLDKGKQKAVTDDEDSDTPVIVHKTRDNKRRAAEGTGKMHETPCENCAKKEIQCEIEAGGGACVFCWKRKVKCLHAAKSRLRKEGKGQPIALTKVKKSMPRLAGGNEKETEGPAKGPKMPSANLTMPSDGQETGGESPKIDGK